MRNFALGFQMVGISDKNLKFGLCILRTTNKEIFCQLFNLLGWTYTDKDPNELWTLQYRFVPKDRWEQKTLTENGNDTAVYFSTLKMRFIMIMSAKESDSKKDHKDFVSFAVYISVCCLYFHTCISFVFFLNKAYRKIYHYKLSFNVWKIMMFLLWDKIFFFILLKARRNCTWVPLRSSLIKGILKGPLMLAS